MGPYPPLNLRHNRNKKRKYVKAMEKFNCGFWHLTKKLRPVDEINGQMVYTIGI